MRERNNGYRCASDFNDQALYHAYMIHSVEPSKPEPTPWDRSPRDEAEREESQAILDRIFQDRGLIHVGSGVWCHPSLSRT